MSAKVTPIAADEPTAWAFTPENRAKADAFVKKYPPGRQASAVLALLDLAQRQHGWVPQAAIEHVAGILDMAPIRVYEVATFYFMYNLKPVGKQLVQVCRTTPCWLRGSDQITRAVEEVRQKGLIVISLNMAGSVPDVADLVVSDPVQAGVMAVMAIADTATFNIVRQQRRRY